MGGDLADIGATGGLSLFGVPSPFDAGVPEPFTESDPLASAFGVGGGGGGGGKKGGGGGLTPEQREIRYLLLHGVLHCLGYDHETDQGEMEQLEGRLRRRWIAHVD